MAEEKEVKKPVENVDVFAFSDAEYKKYELRRLEFSNALIGTFNAKFDYVISKDILKELVVIEKVIKEISDNRYYAVATSDKGNAFNLKFSVVVNTTDEKTASATLFLLEDVVSVNTGMPFIKSTEIATFKDDNDAYFSIKFKKAFHLISADEKANNGFYDQKKCPLFLAEKMRKLNIKKRFEENEELIDEEYVKQMIKELKKMGKYGEWVLKSFLKNQQLLGDKLPKKGAPKHYKTLARVLDQALIAAKEFPLTKEQREIINQIKNSHSKYMNAQFDYVEILGKSVGKGGKSSGGGKSGGGGGSKSGGKSDSKSGGKKKDNKKKDDKKKDKKKIIIDPSVYKPEKEKSTPTVDKPKPARKPEGRSERRPRFAGGEKHEEIEKKEAPPQKMEEPTKKEEGSPIVEMFASMVQELDGEINNSLTNFDFSLAEITGEMAEGESKDLDETFGAYVDAGVRGTFKSDFINLETVAPAVKPDKQNSEERGL